MKITKLRRNFSTAYLFNISEQKVRRDMKNLYLLLVLMFILNINAQFKEELNKPVDIRSGVTNNQPSQFFLNFLDMSKFEMHHSFSLSYSAMGSQGLSLGVYTNSMSYKFNDKLNLKVDASLVNSPYNTLGDEFTNKLNGLYISKAELNFNPTEDMHLTIQYFHPPNGLGSYYGYGYRNNPFLW